MLRKSSSHAEATAQKAPEAGWKYLVRHAAFVKDLTRLLSPPQLDQSFIQLQIANSDPTHQNSRKMD